MTEKTFGAGSIVVFCILSGVAGLFIGGAIAQNQPESKPVASQPAPVVLGPEWKFRDHRDDVLSVGNTFSIDPTPDTPAAAKQESLRVAERMCADATNKVACIEDIREQWYAAYVTGRMWAAKDFRRSLGQAVPQ